MQWKRVPDIHAQVETLQDAEAWLDEIFAAKRAEQPERAAEIDALDAPEERKRLSKEPRSGPSVAIRGRSCRPSSLEGWRCFRSPRRVRV